MSETFKMQFGMCDIFVDGEKSFPLLGEAAEFLAEPIYEEVNLYEIHNYDRRLTGWNVTFKIVLEDHSYEALLLGQPMLTTINEGGYADGKLMQSARDKAKEIRIHPRELPTSNREEDIVIYKAFPVSSYEKKFGKEVSKWEIEFVGLAFEADPTKVGNYFGIGDIVTEE